jgi:hypothetical protein
MEPLNMSGRAAIGTVAELAILNSWMLVMTYSEVL